MTFRGIASLIVVALIAVACAGKDDPLDARPINGSTETGLAEDAGRYTAVLEAAGLGHRADALLAKAQVSVRLVPRPYDPDVDAGRSRISGYPDMAPDTPWPAMPDGRYLAFVAQINLAEMPTEDAGRPYAWSDDGRPTTWSRRSTSAFLVLP